MASAVSASSKASRNSFYHPALSYLCFIGIAISWLVPDRRIERVLEKKGYPSHGRIGRGGEPRSTGQSTVQEANGASWKTSPGEHRLPNRNTEQITTWTWRFGGCKVTGSESPASMSREMRKQLGVLGYMKIVLMVLKRWGIGGSCQSLDSEKISRSKHLGYYRRTQTLTVPRIRRTSEFVVTSIRVSNDSQ